MLAPLTFEPIFKQRVWGGRNLERLFGKPLPPNSVIGESWEISDRPDDVSIVREGPFGGRNLHWLMETRGRDLLGDAADLDGRFPLLVKILDAQQDLSLQVHPPPHKAKSLGGAPKTEMWYVVEATPGAVFYAGLKSGQTRQSFETRLRDGTVAECFHRIPVRPGDSLFLPSGRVHAIGAGNVLFEIQQNSDTTYRVFDWNRVGLDGHPRELHIEQSLQSIDFEDFEPALADAGFTEDAQGKLRLLADHPLFRVIVRRVAAGRTLQLDRNRMGIVGQVSGQGRLASPAGDTVLRAGQFCLVPASVAPVWYQASTDCEFLLATAGTAPH
jgi:mannose-6-phosphate isomerase